MSFLSICFVFSEGKCNSVRPWGRCFLTPTTVCLCQLRNITSMAEDIFWDPCHFRIYSKYEAVPTKFRLHKPHFQLVLVLLSSMGRDSSVGIAPGYGLDGPGIESRWGISPSLLYNGYRVPFPRVKRPGPGVDHPPHLAVMLKKE